MSNTTRLQAVLAGIPEADHQVTVTVNASDLRALLAKSEARRKAIVEAQGWISNWDPNFVQDDEWPASAASLKAALADVP